MKYEDQRRKPARGDRTLQPGETMVTESGA